MADELTIDVSMAYADTVKSDSLSVEDVLTSISSKKPAHYTQNVGTSEEALILADVGTLGYVLLVNRDTTNFVNVKTATSGTVFAKLLPNNGMALFHFGSGVTAPFVQADTGACDVEVFLIPT